MPSKNLEFTPVNDLSDPLRISIVERSVRAVPRVEVADGSDPLKTILRSMKEDPSLANIGDVSLDAAVSTPLSHPPLMSPADFVAKTAIRFKIRSEDTLKVDRAYAAFHARAAKAMQKPGSSLADPVMKHEAIGFLGSLRELVAVKGGKWSDVTRNVQSEGLLQQWHTYLETVWGSATDTAVKVVRRAVERDAQHARFGVMWLLGQTEIDLDWAVALGEGLVTLGAAGAEIGVGVSSGSVASMTRDTVFSVQGVDVTGSALSTGGRVLGGIITSGIASPNAAREAKGPSAVTERAQDSISGKGPGWYVPSFPCTRATFEHIERTPINGVADVPGLIVGGAIGMGVAIATDVVVETVRTIGQNVYQAACAFLEKMRTIWHVGEAPSVVGPLIKSLAGYITKEVCTAAAPFVGGGLNVGKGIAQIVEAAAERVGLWQERRKIKLSEGHFSLIGDSIETQVSKGMLTGLATVLKGAGDLAANVLLPGAGALVSVLMTALEWGVKTLMRICENKRIKAFLDDAKNLWDREVALHAYNERTQVPSGSIIARPEAFTAFFKRGCDASVVLPMLTLNSGMCGSIWQQIQMVSSAGAVITQSTFDDGVRYFGRLKRFSGVYLRAAGFTFKARRPGSQVEGVLRHAVRDHRYPATLSAQALRALAT